ncbi:MAG: hypothetical protein H7A51_11530 [Akkermansiaceae bacterium]|nr:hypothetical protein [Akkermansiaceae bacterium]
MKKTLLPILFGLAITATVQAGPDPMPSGKEIIPPPPPSCLWTWFAGASGGYLSGDWDEEIYTLHVGAKHMCQGDNCSHALYLEVGYTEKELSKQALLRTNAYGDHTGPVKGIGIYESYRLEMEIIPISFNYKYECGLTDQLRWYAGVGAGVALVDADLRHSEYVEIDDDVVFFAHVFVGIVYSFNESFEIFAGAKYIYMDEPTLGNFLDFHGVERIATLDDNIHFEVGGRIKF